MDRKREIAADIWDIMRRVYNIGDSVVQSEKQTQFINDVVTYLDVNLSIRRKTQESKEKKCSKQSQTP